MKSLTFGFLFSLLFSTAACGHQSDGVLDLNGGAATASPATTSGIVNFTFPDMQNIDLKSPAVTIIPNKGVTVDPGNPTNLTSTEGRVSINYSASSIEKIEQLTFTISSSGLPDVVLASGKGPGEMLGSATFSSGSATNFAPYLRASAFSVTAAVTYTETPPTPTLFAVDVSLFFKVDS